MCFYCAFHPFLLNSGPNHEQMAATGYSETPLIRKLGIRPEMKIQLINAPENYFELLETDILAQVVKSGGDFIHIFAVSARELEKQFKHAIKAVTPGGMIWISWYKKSCKIPTDITEDTIREIVLPAGWVDVKICAVSEKWSGLKIVRRKNNR
jgi:hypothetical protein